MSFWNPLSWLDSPQKKRKLLIEEALYSISQIIDVCQRLANKNRPPNTSAWLTDLETVYHHSKNAEKKLKEYGKIPHAGKIFSSALLGANDYGLKLFKEYQFSDSEAKFRVLKADLEKLLGAIERGTDLL
ncbi:MAG: hypothetical protein Q8R04_03340 [Nanoarchaeota archaeon]|nr:hypothetical protein [Nanoarchaeota archaeon]